MRAAKDHTRALLGAGPTWQDPGGAFPAVCQAGGAGGADRTHLGRGAPHWGNDGRLGISLSSPVE